MWTPRVRTAVLTLTDPFLFTDLILVERYGQPDSLSITGDIEDLRATLTPGSGVVLVDDNGVQRFSGQVTSIERHGDGTATATYVGDLQLLWKHGAWPTPANHWDNQTAPYDVQTAVHETRILGYINRNAGSIAYNGTSGGVAIDRRVSHLRLPTTAGRGTSGKTSARFKNLGQLVADLAEAAGLRVTVKQTYEGTTPFLDVVVDDAPDYSTWARFGDAKSGDLGMLGEEWSYTIGSGPSVFLSAAGGALENRFLTAQVDSSILSVWGYEEFFIDQRDDGSDTDQIAQGIAAARAENAPTVEVSSPIVSGELEFGPDVGAIPVGAKVAVSLDGELVVDRIRQLTTTVAVNDGEETVTSEPLVGSPDAGLTFEQKALRRALRRIRNQESQ